MAVLFILRILLMYTFILSLILMAGCELENEFVLGDIYD